MLFRIQKRGYHVLYTKQLSVTLTLLSLIACKRDTNLDFVHLGWKSDKILPV